MKVDRELFIKELESVEPGIGLKAEELQSQFFIFRDSTVGTFNGEVCCRRPSLVNITGAIPSEPLLALLRKLKEAEVGVEITDNRFTITGKNKRAGINYEKTIDSPIDSVETPEKWRKIVDNFLEAVALVQDSASQDSSQFNLRCLHLHPQWIEACDNLQVTRYKIVSGFQMPIMVKQAAIKHVPGLGPTKFAETSSFLHFKRSDGLIISCRRYVEEYPDLTKFLKTTGHKWAMPKGLKDAAEKAEVFANKSKSNLVKLTIQPGKLTMMAEGEQGYYMEAKKLDYDGERLSFKITPKMLKELVERHNDVLVSQEKIKVNGGKYEFAAALELPDKKEASNAKRSKEKEEG